MAAAAPKYTKAAGATSAAVLCPSAPLLLASNWESSDSVDVAQPDKPAPTTKPCSRSTRVHGQCMIHLMAWQASTGEVPKEWQRA